ncbi:hypothetical protein F4859DRAFT_517249 [Xylaria cf. heliscus]|nr:hypothetical protein F4859DRAFT_517249 [Xylaria cf. heliscus]
MGHLSPSTMKSELLPSQKAIIAMSRAQYLAHLRPSPEDRRQAAFTTNSEKDKDGRKRNPARPIDAAKPTDKLSVGVCIFRLDGQTLSPAVLLLRRSPRRWRRRILASVGGRYGAGEWELPGGKVENDDFCISAAIERLVREKTGLRVTKIMVMLSDVRWRKEFKVLLWQEDEVVGSAGKDSSEDEHSDGGEVELKVGWEVDMEWMSCMQNEGRNADNGSGNGTLVGNSDEISSAEETLASPPPIDLETLGIHLPIDSSSPGSSALIRLTTDSGSGSSSVSAPPVPPKDPGRYASGYGGYNNDYDDYDEYHADHGYCTYECEEDHDPSLEPAPLSLPSRKPKPPRCRTTVSSAALPASLTRISWRDAQVIPYKMARKEYVQLNFTVLVDEELDEKLLPGFLRRHADGGREGDGEKKVYEHDAFEWATCARVEKLPMSDDLRRVVFEGLAWMGTLTGAYF